MPLTELVDASNTADLRVELGGDAVFLNAPDETSPFEGVGILIALLVLLVAFGTVVAALVPIGLALVAVGAGIGGIFLLASVMDVSPSAIPIAGIVGLGVGIDYALFIVARYRENRDAGRDNADRPGQRDVLVRRGGRLRRRHRGHRDGVPRPHRARRPDLDRPGHRHRGAERGRGSDHPAAGTAGSARRPHRHGPAAASSPPRQARRGDRLVALRPPGLGTALAVPDRCRLRPVRLRRPGLRDPDRLARGGRRSEPRRRTGRPTTCWTRASVPGSTGRCWSSST